METYINIDQENVDSIIAEQVYNDFHMHLAETFSLVEYTSDVLNGPDTICSIWFTDTMNDIRTSVDIMNSLYKVYLIYDDTGVPIIEEDDLEDFLASFEVLFALSKNIV